MGGTIDPHQAWLVLRGIKTLSMRVVWHRKPPGAWLRN